MKLLRSIIKKLELLTSLNFGLKILKFVFIFFSYIYIFFLQINTIEAYTKDKHIKTEKKPQLTFDVFQIGVGEPTNELFIGLEVLQNDELQPTADHLTRLEEAVVVDWRECGLVEQKEQLVLGAVGLGGGVVHVKVAEQLTRREQGHHEEKALQGIGSECVVGDENGQMVDCQEAVQREADPRRLGHALTGHGFAGAFVKMNAGLCVVVVVVVVVVEEL
jgi:hypothetical protein